MLAGVSGAAGPAAFVMSMTGVSLKSPVDFNIKTATVFNSFNDMSMKLDSVITETNTIGIYTAALSTAVSAIASTVGQAINLPSCELNVSGMTQALFGAIIPPSVTAVYADLNALNQRLQDLVTLEGWTEELLGVHLPLTASDVVAQLKNNAIALAELNLPSDAFQFAMDPCAGIATMILNRLSLPINTETVPVMNLPKFRDLVDQIFENISSSSPPPTPPAPIGVEDLPPITIIGPRE